MNVGDANERHQKTEGRLPFLLLAKACQEKFYNHRRYFCSE